MVRPSILRRCGRLPSKACWQLIGLPFVVVVSLLTKDLTIKVARARFIECSYSISTLAPGERRLIWRPVRSVRQGSLVIFLIEAPLTLLPITSVLSTALVTTDRFISIRR